MKSIFSYFLFFPLIFTAGCVDNKQEADGSQLSDNQAFKKYWYAQKAEVNSYAIKQNYAGNVNNGEAILIFNTENFHTDSQVKAESQNSTNAISVMKMNCIQKIVTGISDNSMYLSVFTPVQVNKMPATLKVVTTSQDWEAQTFTQLNFRHNGYQIFGKSDSENETDADYHIDYALLEDEIWNKIRVSPEKLPEGPLMMIPSMGSLNLLHKKIDAEMAQATLSSYQDSTFKERTLMKYVINYPTSKRNLSIFFDKNFPYQIVGWQESNAMDNKTITTKATLKASILNPFWQKNTPIDTVFRKLLKI